MEYRIDGVYSAQMDRTVTMPNFIKLTLVGDSDVGRSYLGMAHIIKRFPADGFDPRGYVYFASEFVMNGTPYKLRICETDSKTHINAIRHCVYRRSHVFLLCYSVDNPISLENISHKWYPDVKHRMPNTPVVIVATKIDLRGSSNTPYVTWEEGSRVAQSLNCSYFETSSLMMIGLKECFEQALQLAVNCSLERKAQEVQESGTGKKTIPDCPVMPLASLAPWIEIKTSTMGRDMGGILADTSGADVVFHLDDGKTHSAHRVMLCSASDFFCRVFEQKLPKVQQEDPDIPVSDFTWEEINSGSIAGLSSIAQAGEEADHKVDICLAADVQSLAFQHVLEFLYGGLPNVDEDSPEQELNDLKKVADIFQLTRLREVVENIQKREEFLNPSIGADLNDLMGQRLKELFFNKPLFSDTQFEVEGETVYAHRPILKARSTVLAGMFSGVFTESSVQKIPIRETSRECFLAILEYLYTDCAPIEDGDVIGILITAERFALDRLKNLCEHYIIKEVDVSVSPCIKKADIDVIGLLHTAQFHQADQLAAWCLHFISSNYLAFEKRAEFTQLEGDNLTHVTEKRWPPVSYMNESAEWEKKYGKKKSCMVM